MKDSIGREDPKPFDIGVMKGLVLPGGQGKEL
jgi:hypothetical protein